MNKTLLAIAVASLPLFASAQSAVDAYTLSQTDLRGTARFMSMGGAFTALGGDLSSLNQNPAGIGVYRRSEIGATLDITPRKITATTGTNAISQSQTKVACNNFGYVGTARLDGAMRPFSWGDTYNRVASFDRVYDAYDGATSSSLSNYIALYTSGTPFNDIIFGENYNPYLDSSHDWLSILGATSYMINPIGENQYQGLYDNNTIGDAYSQIRESGYVDEYAIDFGGNISDVVYWGIGFGLTDLSFNQTTSYSESMADATIESEHGYVTNGDAGFELVNRRNIHGDGWNFKVGLIARPINELRIGVAVHTPTWYELTSSGYATSEFSYYNPNAAEGRDNPLRGYEETDDAYYNFCLHTPWKFMVGAAAVIGNNAIISLDYERQSYGDMSLKYQDRWGGYVSDEYTNGDISNYYKASDIIRLGLEYRVTPRFSVRAGYNYATTNVKQEVLDGYTEVLTAGTNPAYTLNKDTYAVSFGLGYRYKAFYIDGAYVYRNRKTDYHAYTNYADVVAPQAELSEDTHSIVFSAGFKF